MKKKTIYASNADLPRNVQHLPTEAQDIFRKTINELWIQTQSLGQATKGAWEAVKKEFSKKADGYWYKN